MRYESTIQIESKLLPEVSFTIARMSLARRAELLRRIRELAQRVEFLAAGEDIKEQIEAAILAHEVERLYLEWGLVAVHGLEIDAREATPEALIEAGPESLCREVLEAIRAECGLSEEERKN